MDCWIIVVVNDFRSAFISWRNSSKKDFVGMVLGGFTGLWFHGSVFVTTCCWFEVGLFSPHGNTRALSLICVCLSTGLFIMVLSLEMRCVPLKWKSWHASFKHTLSFSEFWQTDGCRYLHLFLKWQPDGPRVEKYMHNFLCFSGHFLPLTSLLPVSPCGHFLFK